ncbi:MAG: hypothetical protein ACI39E_02180 [Acutalibacteraceae bacterium]
MKLIRKIAVSALAVLMAVSMLLMSACSTPAVAMTVDGKDYSTGEYLANLYNSYYLAYYSGGLYQYAQYGMDPWEQSMTYGEGDEAVSMKLADYLVQITKDNIIRQKAVENLMAEYEITADEELMNEFNSNFESYKESEMLQYGFNREHYRNMYIEANINERSLFYALYGENGAKAVSEDDIRAYFDQNFVAYKAISVSMVDSEGNEYSDADKQATKDNLNNYLELYKATGDFDAVIAQYNMDTAEKEETADTATTDTTDAADTADTTTADTTTAETDASEQDATQTTAAEDTAEASEPEDTAEEEEDSNVQLADSVTGDAELVKAVVAVPENTAQVIEYTTSSGTLTAALVLRLNVEKEGGDGYYENQHDNCLYGLKFDEFDKDVKTVADSLTVTYNDAAINACDPKNFDTTSKS